MITCFIPGCSWKATCPALYSLHLRRLHEPIDVYTCSEHNCGRRFNVRCSYINHIKKHMRNNVESRKHREHRITVGELNPIEFETDNTNDTISTIEVVEQEEKDDQNEPRELICIEKLSQEFGRLSVGFNLKWLNKSSVTRKLVFEFQEDVRDNILKPIQDVVEIMSESGLISTLAKNALSSMFSMFSNVQSEYQFVRQLKAMQLYEDPIIFTISNELRPGVIHHKLDMIADEVKGVLMPICFQLKKYLESPNMLDTIIKNLKPTQDGVIKSLIDGQIWSEKVKGSGEKIIIPVNLFIDDFTTSDTVSPHSGSTKICGVYYYIACLPPYILSKLHSINIAGFFYVRGSETFWKQSNFL